MENFIAGSQIHEYSIVSLLRLERLCVNEKLSEFVGQLNAWGSHKTPFLFMVDFEMKKPKAWKLSEISRENIKYNIQGFTNAQPVHVPSRVASIRVFPNSFTEYESKFNSVIEQLQNGNSFLINLTDMTRIETESSLVSMFDGSTARYKLLYRDEFLVFSPEIFIQIRDGKIFSFPMKGTIDASTPNAKEKILSDQKELAEHVTIVDLIRNDLSQVASNVKVERFRYIEEIKTKGKTLLQVSSEITGDLESDYSAQIGHLIMSLLPAGSVSGAPKTKTLEIIREVEKEPRGYYTGVFGYFDGRNLDSGVMIRFIERRGDQLWYRSGGGITTQSTAQSEYQELMDKVYVPID
jgi:para-aminobenzoate synthetase component I